MRPRITIDFEDWPALDQHLWTEAFKLGGLFDLSGPAAQWRSKTRRQVAKDYGLWLCDLQRQVALEATALPATRITVSRLRKFIATMENYDWASTTITTRICNLREAIRVMEPGADLGLLDRVLRRLRRSQTPSRDKAARVVHPRRILDAALAFMDGVPAQECDNEVIRSTWYRDGLIVALLAVAPVRLQNLTDIELNRHLVRVGDTWHLRLSADETKEHRRLELPLPEPLDRYIERYLREYRPRLLRGRDSLRLWISIRATPMTCQTVYCSVCKRTEKLLGKRINPHLFRDCLATAMATDTPANVRAAGRILGHASFETTESYYIQAEQQVAVRRLHETLRSLGADGAAENKP